MSAFYPANVRRGPREMTPLLLLLLLSRLAGIVLCQYEDGEADPPLDGEGMTEPPSVEVDPTGDTDPLSTDNLPADIAPTPGNPSITDGTMSVEGSTDEGSSPGEDPTSDPTSEPLEEGLSPTIILVPVVLVVVIIAMVVCGIVINRKWNKKMSETEQRKEDSFLDGNSTDKVPMPMFEDDIPSVLELEMEELDQWMNKDV